MRKYGKWVLTLLVVAWCVVIWQFSLAPGEVSAKTSGEVLDFCNNALQNAGIDAEVTGQTVRKTAHFGEFFLLGIFTAACLLAHGFRHWLLLSPAVFVPAAAIDECIQLFVPDRGPHILDVLLDALGGACGALSFFVVFSLLLYIIIKRKEKISKTP
ncbi:MAG: VanZ family protein [Clostridia bacterium]|nr:VanZ family protein [Clostridia bacterium]